MLLAGCGDDGSSGDPAPSTAPPSTTATSAPSEAAGWYLSLGDSYAQGYQPGQPADGGFATHVPGLAAERGWDLELVNLGCGGATTTSLVETPGCAEAGRAPGAPAYEEPQLEAAITFAEEHPGEVRLVTVSISGNDVTSCVQAPDPVACVAAEMTEVRDVLTPALARLREAVGPDATILGLTYPDVILGSWVSGGEDLARLSVVAFRDFINPTLEEAYATADAGFVDVTAGTDAYVPLEQTTATEEWGEVPVAVARVCELTWFCERQDIHANDAGYRRIAELVTDALPEG